VLGRLIYRATARKTRIMSDRSTYVLVPTEVLEEFKRAVAKLEEEQQRHAAVRKASPSTYVELDAQGGDACVRYSRAAVDLARACAGLPSIEKGRRA